MSEQTWLVECPDCCGSGIDIDAERAAAPSRCCECKGKGYVDLDRYYCEELEGDFEESESSE